MYPILAVRELAANALIHQDFAITGTGPMIEIFDDRMEITNPGKPLVSTDRFLDTAPRSRNEALASFMRRAGICEERGSGIDKVVFETELHQLPAPFFEMAENATRAVLFAHKELREMRQGGAYPRLLSSRLPALCRARADDEQQPPKAVRHSGAQPGHRLPDHR